MKVNVNLDDQRDSKTLEPTGNRQLLNLSAAYVRSPALKLNQTITDMPKQKGSNKLVHEIEQLVADAEEIDMPAYLKSIRNNNSMISQQAEREKQKAIETARLRQTAEMRMKNLSDLDEAIKELEME